MLKLLKHKPTRKLELVADPSATREDLQIRSLLDYPSLRRAMGLDPDFDIELRADDAAA
jgi:hypothetical protein